jgi:hypothetical protein
MLQAPGCISSELILSEIWIFKERKRWVDKRTADSKAITC